MSFLLRALGANGLTIGQASRWLGFRVAHRLSAAEVRLLAWVTDCSPAWLQHRLLHVQQERGTAVWSYLGHRFLPGPWSRDRVTAICPSCLNEQGFCHGAWNVSAFCACPEHRSPLIDRCPRCHAPITWNRPAVDVCICHRTYITPCDPPEPAGIRASAWSSWIRHRLVDPGDRTDPPPGLPIWIAHLSVDGTARLMQAFGLLTHALQAPTPADLQRRHTPRETCAIVERAIDRLLRLDHASEKRSALSAEIHLPGIQALADRGLTEADRQIAAQVLARLTPPAKRRTPSGQERPRQLDLFDREAHHA